ncbi:hypothetical protein O181_120516 [Austropuccinia psidii MF-1]|uniref:Uncharacterized protein n=1 Tax=Austropuccinia psidii MF-1 TaxID=1389203 RepID=A0A9Q3KHT0_9BASI|nr:hypothetical protein [Austropuccinia psidii MF-1]
MGWHTFNKDTVNGEMQPHKANRHHHYSPLTQIHCTIGALSYVETGERPDVAFAVNLLAQHANHPGKEHWKYLQHLLGYIPHTKNIRLCLHPRHISPALNIWSDASWRGRILLVNPWVLAQLSGCSISWCAKRLTTVAASSCHAAFMEQGLAARHGKWLKNL